MNNNIFILLQKAGFIACLFCLATANAGYGQSFTFNENVQRAYTLTLDLQFENARRAVGNDASLQANYVATLNEVLELLLTEDPALFAPYEERFENRLFKNPKNSDERFLLAEMNLQWAFVYLKFGHELDAASHFREAYKIAMECRRKSPAYIPIRKTTGMLEVMVGAVPEKYNWIMDLFGIHGSIQNGLNDLTLAGASTASIASEARLIKSLIEGYVLQQATRSASALQKQVQTDTSKSFKLGAASLYIKSSQSEKAIELLLDVKNATPVTQYFLGEVFIHKGEYDQAIKSYQQYISTYKGNNNLKDAWFKTAMCYWLMGNTEVADSLFAIAKEKGNEIMEADRSAARTMAADRKPNVVLTKARYSTDGGYYDNARTTLAEISDKDLVSKRDKVEYYYRRARLEHGTKHGDAAKIFYQQVIDMAGTEPWYFAPNACLQMGYLFLEEKNETKAKEFFKKALTYKNHEYKNSIDSKAKTALNEMKK